MTCDSIHHSYFSLPMACVHLGSKAMIPSLLEESGKSETPQAQCGARAVSALVWEWSGGSGPHGLLCHVDLGPQGLGVLFCFLLDNRLVLWSQKLKACFLDRRTLCLTDLDPFPVCCVFSLWVHIVYLLWWLIASSWVLFWSLISTLCGCWHPFLLSPIVSYKS